MADTPFDSYGGDAAVADTDVFICKTAAGGGKNPTGARFIKYAPNGYVGIFTSAPTKGLFISGGADPAAATIHVSGATASPGTLEMQGGGSVFSISGGASCVFTQVGIGVRMQITAGGTVQPGSDNSQTLGAAATRWSTLYAGTGSINTSDEREKQQIETIPDEWLDAWADVAWSRFKFNDSVAAKGTTGARWHAGLIAQAVQAAFTAHGIDATEIGLLCHDEWPEVPATAEQLDDDGNVIVPANPESPAGDRYGLRYEECFAVEAAYQRRRMAAIEARLAALETPPS